MQDQQAWTSGAPRHQTGYVLWKVYAGCMDGDEERINRLIEKALDT